MCDGIWSDIWRATLVPALSGGNEDRRIICLVEETKLSRIEHKKYQLMVQVLLEMHPDAPVTTATLFWLLTLFLLLLRM